MRPLPSWTFGGASGRACAVEGHSGAVRTAARAMLGLARSGIGLLPTETVGVWERRELRRREPTAFTNALAGDEVEPLQFVALAPHRVRIVRLVVHLLAVKDAAVAFENGQLAVSAARNNRRPVARGCLCLVGVERRVIAAMPHAQLAEGASERVIADLDEVTAEDASRAGSLGGCHHDSPDMARQIAHT
jgi:hypothetical protein